VAVQPELQPAFTIRELGTGDADVELVYPIIHELRDKLSLGTFSSRYRGMYERDGYRIAALFVGDECRAAAGYRLILNLAHGRSLYVDDLVTGARWRSHGYGAALLGYLVDSARERGVDAVRLDSGVQREDAHRFYEREGFAFIGKHFWRGFG
jgi:GNAT superfamily N-acetyltransferase